MTKPKTDQVADALGTDLDKTLVGGVEEVTTDEAKNAAAAVAAAQTALLDLPDGDLPDALAEARRIRLEAYLAADPATRWRNAGHDDPRVIELEAPYRRGTQTTADTE